MMRAQRVRAVLLACGASLTVLFTPVTAGGQTGLRTVAPATTDAFIGWARANAIQISLSRPGSAASPPRAADLQLLAAVIGDARVVALGEPAHGAHEPLAFRNRLFAWLVQEQHFSAIAIESGLCESQEAYTFVLGGPGDAASVTRHSLTWGFGAFAENVELIRWIRDWNLDASHVRKVRFYGIDLCGGAEAGLPGAGIALSKILAYFARVAPDLARDARAVLQPHLEQFTDKTYPTLPEVDRRRVRDALAELKTVLVQRRDALAAASTAIDYEWALQDVVVAQSLEHTLKLWPRHAPTIGVSADSYASFVARDAAMADNIRWVLEREGPSGHILVFAHDGHVQNGSARGGLWSVYTHAPEAMGKHLRSFFGEHLLIIGASAGVDAAPLPAAIHHPEGLDEALAAVGLPAFLLDLRRASDMPAIQSWLAQPRSLRANFTTEFELSPGEAFDALVFFATLTPAGSAE